MSNDLYHGDCREIRSVIADNTIDTIITDPPYELGFMGKGWDKSGIVLDPFAGSGTTLLAAKNTGRGYIGIEQNEEYIKIIEARLGIKCE